MLLACTALAPALANSPAAEGVLGFWKSKVGIRVGSFEVSTRSSVGSTTA